MTIRSGSIMAAVLAGAMLWAAGAQAAVRYVALDGSGADGRSWETAYRTIEEAIDDPTIQPGDEIRVKEGTYVLSSSIDVDRALNIYGGYSGSGSIRDWNAYRTTIDGRDEAKRAFNLYASARIDGFTITRGLTWGIPPNQGGALWIDSCAPTIANCTFYRNRSQFQGGAIALQWANGTRIVNCAFVENSATLNGGAIYNYDSDFTATGCLFTANTSAATVEDPEEMDPEEPMPGGGAIYNEYGQPTISECEFNGNGAYYGAGIANYFADALIENCVFADCDYTTSGGGGVYNYGCSATVFGCLFSGNEVSSIGGGILDASTSTYVNCILSDNLSHWHGGGVYLQRSGPDALSRAVLTNCTMYGNHAGKGGGLYSDNAISTMTNCIVWGNSALSNSDGPGIFDSKSVWSGAGVGATYCDIQGSSTFPGTGNIRVDPAFADPTGGDFELTFGSPAIDVGTDSAPELPTTDFAGKPRIADGNEDGVAVVDMGALEYRGRYVGDYLLAARIFQTNAYDDPSDAVPTSRFLLELETTDAVVYVQFLSPGGRTYTIMMTPTSGDGAETYHEIVNGVHLWGYRAVTGPTNPMVNYGNGTYTVTLHYGDNTTHETNLWYGVPNSQSYLTMPEEKPVVTSPSYGDVAGSPVTFAWQPCTDPYANHASVALFDSGGDPVVTDIVEIDRTNSNALTLQEGWYAADVAFEHSYAVTTTDMIPFDYGKVASVGHETEVVFSMTYRFWSPRLLRHFYTLSVAERDSVRATYPDTWTYEGPVFHAYATQYVDGLAPVYRFWSPKHSSHFYTIDEGEKNSVMLEYPDSVWTYEGPVFFAYPPNKPHPADAKPVHRFWNERESTHFYTMSESEKDHILATWGHFVYEGVAFYAYE